MKLLPFRRNALSIRRKIFDWGGELIPPRYRSGYYLYGYLDRCLFRHYLSIVVATGAVARNRKHVMAQSSSSTRGCLIDSIIIDRYHPSRVAESMIP